MSEDVLLREDVATLDKYFKTVQKLSSKPVCDFNKREKTYTAIVKLLVERVNYIKGCDPSKDNGMNHARSLAYMLAMFIGALADCPKNKQEDVQHKNVNYFLNKFYEEMDDPMTFSAITFSGVMTLLSVLGMGRGDRPRQASSAEIVDLVTKARKDGSLKMYKVGESGRAASDLTEEEMDDIISDFMGDDNATVH